MIALYIIIGILGGGLIFFLGFMVAVFFSFSKEVEAHGAASQALKKQIKTESSDMVPDKPESHVR